MYMFVYIYTYIQTDTTSRARMRSTAQQPLQIHRDIYAHKFVHTYRHRGANMQIYATHSHDLCAHMLLTVQQPPQIHTHICVYKSSDPHVHRDTHAHIHTYKHDLCVRMLLTAQQPPTAQGRRLGKMTRRHPQVALKLRHPTPSSTLIRHSHKTTTPRAGPGS